MRQRSVRCTSKSKAQILQSLQNAEWQPGDVIPSEFDLAARFGVSQGTVRKAIDELAAENLLVRKQGKGTFVATHAEHQVRVPLSAFTPRCGYGAERGACRAADHLVCRRVRATAEIAKVVGLAHRRTLIHVRRVLRDGGVPPFANMWLPPDLQRTNGRATQLLSGRHVQPI